MSSALTKGCLTFDERPQTPPEVRKYRRSTNLEPGKRFQHYGLADDYNAMDLTDKIYGKTDKEVPTSAGDLLSHPKPSELERMAIMRAEMKYKTNKREPLGRVPDRGIILPKKFTEEKEPFGEKSQASSQPAKDLIFPHALLNDGKDEEIYKRSHGSYGVSEQLKRGYVYPESIDPLTTRFGRKGDMIALNGTSKNITEVLQGDLKDNRDSCVNMKQVEDFRNMKDILGQSKNLGQDSFTRGDMVYGKANRGKGFSAGEVIKGKYTEDDNMPDMDLGKSITPGFRNISMENRMYGCPSIRNDIPCLPAHRRSLADSQNYGDDVPAQELINPPAFSDLSIGPTIMQERKSKEKLLELFGRIGYSFTAETADRLFQDASGGASTASINSFRSVLNEYLITQDLY
jgi:hypothetical protein